MNTPLPPTVGAILAGGEGRRMGGLDKPFVLLDGKPLLAHVVSRLEPQCTTLVINANGDASRFSDQSLAVIPDVIEGRPGPLAGIHACLEVAARRGASWIVSVPCDCPLIPHDLVARLQLARLQANAQIAMASSNGRAHPTIAVWSISLQKPIADALAQGQRKVGQFAAMHPHVTVAWNTDCDPFVNINTPADLTAVAANIIEPRC